MKKEAKNAANWNFFLQIWADFTVDNQNITP